MKNLLFILLCTISITVTAQTGLGDTQRALGQTSGDAITHEDVAIGAEGTYKLAAMLMPEQLLPYEGCDIVGIRFALGMDMARSAVFLNSFNTKDNTISADIISQTVRYPSKGWNNIFFNSSQKYTITAGEGLLFGFEYTESASMVANDQGAICINGENKSGNGFFLYGNFGQGEGWYSSETGTLCVQLIVDVSNMPANDILFTTLTTGHKYKKRGEGIDFFCAYENAGRDKIATIDFTVTIDGVAVQTYSCTNETGASSLTLERILPVPESLEIGQHTFTVSVDNINGAAPATPHSISENFVVYENTLSRQKHLVEQYMSQKSTYNQYTDNIMSQVAKDDKACLVNMYNTDGTLGISEAQQYVSRYAYDYPCFTIDRSYYPGENYVAYDVNYYAQAVPEIMVGVIQQMVDEQDYYPAFATVNLDVDYDKSNRALTIDVDGDLIENAAAIFDGNAVLTVLLTENNVKAPQVITDAITGRNKTSNSYVHQNVLRQFVSSDKGDAISLDADSYRMHYELTLPASYNENEVEVVAFVSKGVNVDVTPQNINDFDITNCNSQPLAAVMNGIENVYVNDDDNDDENFLPIEGDRGGLFNLLGQRVSTAQKGLVIRNGKKTIVR